jgi:hypothetical protein
VGGGATSSTGTGASPAATAKGSARTNASGTRNAGRTNGATTAPGGTRAGSGEQSGAPGSTTSGTSSNGSPIVNQASSPIRIREQSGSPWPLFLTIAILGGLTLAAVLIARRRRGRAQT